MTMSVLDSAYNVAHDYPGGVPSLAPRIGKNATTLAHELNGTGTAKLGLCDAVKISARAGDLRILAAFAEELNCTIIPLPLNSGGTVAECMRSLCVMSKDFAELCAVATSVLADGDVTDNDLASVGREATELIASIVSLRRALAERNMTGKPAHLHAA